MSADQPLGAVTVVEAATFVAGPSAGMALSQLGAHVIRVDLPGGGSDFGRWPVAPSGASLYWLGLNKGKQSVLIDYRKPAGRELLIELATMPGPGHGVFVDNMVGRRRITYSDLTQRRSDAIHLHVQGKADGGPSVDYTANSAVGIPDITGPDAIQQPVNHVLPAWDLLTGMTAATGVLAALHRRGLTGEGAELTISLDEVALSAVGSLGWLAAALLEGRTRPRLGNHVYGSFGVDFETADGRVMVIALTPGHWRGLGAVTGMAEVFTALEGVLDIDLSEEGERYRHRETIAAVLKPWFLERRVSQVAEALDSAGVLWGRYHTMLEAARLAERDGDLACDVEQPGVGTILATANPLRWSGETRAPEPAPELGADTEVVLADALGLAASEIGRLVDDEIVALPSAGVPA